MLNNFENFYENDSVDFFVERMYDATQAKIYFTGSDSNTEVDAFLDTTSNLFRFSIDSNKLKAGDYSVYSIYTTGTKTKTEYVLDIQVYQDVTSSTYIKETYNEKILKAIDDKINGRFRDDYDSLSIAGRSISRTPMDILFKYRVEFQDKVDEAKNGMGKGNKIKLIWVGRG